MIEDAPRLAGAAALIATGVALLWAGAVGGLRFADVYERVHSARLAAFGAPLVLAGLAVLAWDWRIALRLALVAGAMALTGPALSHLVAHVAYRSGAEPAARARR